MSRAMNRTPHLIRSLTLLSVLLMLALIAVPASSAMQHDPDAVALAYVLDNKVTLADTEGNPLSQPGPEIGERQGARLFWSPNAQKLYIARGDGLFTTGAAGGAAAEIARYYGRTLTISQDEGVVYYLETASPQPVEDPENPDVELVAFPFREIAMDSIGGTGRLAGYFGEYDAASATADVSFAAALYARDGGLLGAGRPELWPTYGANVFGTCCFPEPGLGIFNTQLGEFSVYDAEFIPGAAAINLTRTHLAGPTTTGSLRVIDLITGGSRDYALDIAGGIGTIERVAWSPDDSMLYFIARQPASNPLQLTTETSYPSDTRSADVVLYRLNLVTSTLRELAYRRDVYGVSSLAATDRYVFATVIDPNTALIEKLNARQIRADTSPTDPSMAGLWPLTHLWRVEVNGDSELDVANNVWGVVARPVRR